MISRAPGGRALLEFRSMCGKLSFCEMAEGSNYGTLENRVTHPPSGILLLWHKQFMPHGGGGGAQLENGAVEAEMGAIWALCWKKVSVRASVKNLFSIDVSREEGCSCVCVGWGGV